MNNQEALNIAASGILKQGAYSGTYVSSFGEFFCRYRDSNHNKCAVGHLIPDDLYNSDIEGLRVSHPEVRSLLNNNLDIKFLSSMQRDIHDIPSQDGWDEEIFRSNVEAFAEAYNLENPL